ncbi:protein kinase, partial [Angomonas deanei]
MSLESKYDIDPTVFGTGSHVYVYKCKDKATGATRIAKVYDKNDISERRYEACLLEGTIGKKLPSHVNVMKVLEVFDEPARVVLILEMMEGGTLFQDIVSNGALSEDRAGRLLFDVLTGLQVLHSNGIMHRDIKPENLFFRTGRKDVLAVGDFGFATNKIPATGYLGSPQYSAPELALIGVQGQ